MHRWSKVADRCARRTDVEGPECDNALRSDSSSNEEPLESKQHVRMTYCVPGPVLAGAQHLILIKEM